jgi:ADYC domain
MKSLATILLVASTGCAVDLGPDDESPPSGIVSSVGQDIQSPNGTSLNGTSLNGTSLNGTSLNGNTLGASSVSGHSSSGQTILANSTTAPPWTGSSIVGSTWTGTAMPGNVTVNLRVVGTATQGTGSNSDLWFYQVEYQNTAGWQPLCGLDAGGAPIKAGTVSGTWNQQTAAYTSSTTSFSLVCQTKSIEKCIEMGYKNYKGYSNQLQSCVRMLRADYCGTGTSYTVDGTLINLYDNVGVQADTQSWTMEAAWNTNGATCIKSGISGRWVNTGQTPTCLAAKSTSTCGSSWTGVFVMDEYN